MPPTPRRSALALAAALASLALAPLAIAQETPPPPVPPPNPATPPAAPAPPAAPSGAAAESLQLAKDSFKQGKWSDADAAALKAIEADPKNLEALYIAGASERQLAQLGPAADHLKVLVDASPEFPLAHFQLAYVQFLQAGGLAREGKAEEAKAAYAQAADNFGKELQRDPTQMASLSSRAIALTRSGRFDEAATAHEAWIAAAPQKNDPVVSLAATFASAGKSTEAMATLDRLPDKTPKAAYDATLACANVFVGRGDWSAAIPFLDKASGIDASSTASLALLTEACARAGQIDDAVGHLRKLLTLDPTPDEADRVGEAFKATVGNGKTSPSVTGLDPPTALRIPSPRYPKGADQSTQTEVLLLVQVSKTSAVADTVLVPNRIWKDIRSSGFETEAVDAVKRGKFSVGMKNGHSADLWTVVSVKFKGE